MGTIKITSKDLIKVLEKVNEDLEIDLFDNITYITVPNSYQKDIFKKSFND